MKKQTREKPVFRLAGDKGILIEYGQGIDPGVNEKVRAMAGSVKKLKGQGIVEIIPTYRSLLLIYDPLITRPSKLIRLVEKIEDNVDNKNAAPSRVVEIPVCYDRKFGPDIKNVGNRFNLDTEQVIQIHSKTKYLIYMVGFTPGFPFLGGLDKRLFTPRLTTPRMKVPQGSVGIANNQTGIYPIASPGGWQIIGQTPLKLFAPERKNPFLYKAGDQIKFIPITPIEFTKMKQKEADR